MEEEIVIKKNRSETIFDEIKPSQTSVIAKKTVIKIKRAAQLQYVLAFFGGRRVEREIEVILAGEGAKAEILGVIYGQTVTRINLKTTSWHKVPNTKADIFIKGVLKDSARLDYRGLIKIEKAAQKTNSYLSDRTLMLSKETRALAIPSLEISADDVKASHGVTVGRVDRDQTFYLMSRGLSKKEAERVISQGFLNSVVEKIDDLNIREKVEREIENIKF